MVLQGNQPETHLNVDLKNAVALKEQNDKFMAFSKIK